MASYTKGMGLVRCNEEKGSYFKKWQATFVLFTLFVKEVLLIT